CSHVARLSRAVLGLAPPSCASLLPYTTLFRSNQLGTIQRSYLAFSGTEDLGGGLKATFRLSTRFLMDDGGNEDAAIKPFWYDESDRKSTRLNSSHVKISYAVCCMQEKNIDAEV